MHSALGVVAGAFARLTAKVAVMHFPIGVFFTFILANNYLGDNVAAIQECVVCHCDYAKDTLPVPAVTVVTLSELTVAVVNVSPPPGFEIVKVLG